MINIKIKNSKVLGHLNTYSDFILNKYNSGELDKLKISCPDHTRDRWLKDDYLERIIARGKEHDGYPESIRIFRGIMPDGNETDLNLEELLEYRQVTQELNSALMSELSAKKNTLASTYPPGGWISWHNNANAKGYNILFTWSETGDGWFEYWDTKENKKIRIPDVKGWQCKMGYFGGYDNPDKLVYHAASTECLRITVAYVFAESNEFWQYVVEDIQEEV